MDKRLDFESIFGVHVWNIKLALDDDLCIGF